MNKKNRAVSLLLVIAMVLLIPSLGITVSAEDKACVIDDEYINLNGAAVVIDPDFVAANGTEYVINASNVFSVTVIGEIEVSIIFDGVKIDRSNDDSGQNVDGIYTAGQRLNQSGYWETRPTANNSYYVPTCPFLITGGAKVTARFDGICEFRAGTSGWYAKSDNTNTLLLDSTNRGGYAGIQVDGTSTLIISGAEDLSAYGAYQTANSSTVEGSGRPAGLEYNSRGGGAGIGGGTSYTSPHADDSDYTQGTPGTIIINNGKVTAYGGFQAAGIGGGTNSAATTGMIEINGGVINAHGGAWAAGIGEGDSVKNNASNKFNSAINTYEIMINGGIVNAYGGYSAAAIGTTDELTHADTTSATSGLSITITGGEVTATSGKTGANSLTAAIGAGQSTDMRDNSITIYSTAKVVAASFSQYAISNYGYTTGVPSVNIDPEGYVYLVRFIDDANNRVFNIYGIHKNANGHFMYVPTEASDIADGTINNATNSYYYAYDPGHVSSDGTTIGGFYIVDANGTNVAPANGDSGEYLFDEDSNRYYPSETPALSAYYDTDKLIETITVPGEYKAVAITLPHPDEYGGAYVLEAPQSGDSNGEKLYALLQKDLPGVTSGELVGKTEFSSTHFVSGVNPPVEANIRPNIIVDGTAKPFTDLDVGVYKDGDAQSSLIPSFVDTVYGYTIYVPSETEKFWLDFSFAESYVDENGQDVRAKLSLLTIDERDYTADYDDLTEISLENLDIGYDGRVDVWIKKTDTTTSGLATKTVSYKITLVVKDKYSLLLDLDALDKEYDGIPVDPTFIALIDGEATSDTKIERNPFKTTYGTVTSTNDNDDPEELKVGSRTFSYSVSNVSFDKTTGTAKYIVEFTDGVTHKTTNVEFDINQQGKITFTTSYSYWELSAERNNYYQVYITISNDNKITLQLQFKNKKNDSWTNAGRTTLESISANVTYPPPSSLVISDAEVSAKEEELKQKLETSGEYSVSETISKSETGTTTYSATLGDSTATCSVDYTSSCRVKITVFAVGGENYTDMMTPEEKEAIVYTFYQDSDGDGVYETSLGTTRPKNAGYYKVVATLNAAKYEADGYQDFAISQKEIHIVAIEKWLKYVSAEDIVTYDGVISDPGQVYFDGVISGEEVALELGATFSYVNLGDTSTFMDDITYHDKKIRITNPVLNAESQVNYVLVGVVDNACYVPGQIAYSTVGAIFRKTEVRESPWRKYYPVDESSHLSWVTNADGFTDARIDYHSPVPSGASAENKYGGGTVGIHREYVKLRTRGDTSARYSIDIEFGAMQFQYTRKIWNVNTGEYEGVVGESTWNGNNGTNNAVTIINRSNAEIYYQVEFEIDFMYAAISEGADTGIRAAVYDTNDTLISGRVDSNGKVVSTKSESTNVQVQSLPSAAPSDPTEVGEVRSQKLLLVLSGVPSTITESNGLNYTNVGSITIEIVELSP